MTVVEQNRTINSTKLAEYIPDECSTSCGGFQAKWWEFLGGPPQLENVGSFDEERYK